MTPRDSAGPVRSLKFVTLLVALSPDLLRWGAGLQLRDNGYEELLVALHPQVSEDPSLIPHIKEMITEASFYLFNATKRRVFFRSIKILIPATWTANNYSKVKQESYEKAQVLVTDWHAAPGDSPHTLQYRGCGKEGKYIHFTPDFLLNDALTAGYGSRGRVFVHEWAHLRWGVFDEYNREKPFYINGQNQVKVTRCSSDITGVFVCEKGPCPQENCIISKLFKEGCMFLFNSTQHATASIMFMQSLPSVVEFCNASTHNQEAPNLQNQLCSLRSAWDVIRASGDFQHSEPMKGTELPPPPTFTLLQAGDRVVCLVLDVSSRMAEADRLFRLRQAAAFYLTHMVESHTFVGIASFNGKGEIRAQLHQINSDDDRKLLVSYLPATVSAEAEASVCSGLKKGFEVVEKLKGKAFGSVMILAASGGDQRISDCFLAALSSGSTVHTIALGSSAVDSLEELARLTGGLKFFVPDKSDSTSMIDAFSRISSGTGDVFQQHIQLESTGETVKPHHQLTNSVTVDDGVGNDTTFLVTWQTGGPPEMVLRDPNGRKYHTDDFVTSLALQTARLWIPGTAQPGLWTYTLNNSHHSPQALKVTVTSRASLPAVPPATVEAFVERDSTRFPHPMMIYAIVRRGFYPILNATVTATVEPEAADPVTLRLLDDGAGADVIKNDGIYSRYFFSFAGNGRYSLKVHVSHPPSVSAATRSGPGSHAMYVPGYITNGNIQMNAPRKPVGRSEEEQKWGLSRAASGGSFSVLGVPAGPHPDMFPPCKIVDLEAVKVEEEVALSWTAPGEDFDQGQGNKQLTCSGLSVYTQCQRFTVHNILEENDGVRGISNHHHITGISGDVYFIWHYERRHYGMNYFLRFSLSVGKISIKLRTTQDPYFCYKAKSYEIRISKSLQNIQDDFNSAILVNSSKLKPQQAGTKETFTFSPELFTNGPEHQADGETQRSHRIYVAIRAVDRNSLRSAVSNIAQASLSVPPNSAPVLARDDLILKGVLTAISFIGVICLTIVIIHCTLNRKKRADKRGNETKLL